MPITWQNAFGGEGFDNNPLGKGIAPIETEDGKVHPLPNVELPRKLVKSKRDRPGPTSFGPIDLVWPQRYAKSGTHDAKWLQTHFPSFAADMDWSIFNGMRTLSANIAVEVPEAPDGGTLYRVLFLAALILFVMTFVVNTVAEVVRQRLRERYKAL